MFARKKKEYYSNNTFYLLLMGILSFLVGYKMKLKLRS